MTCPFAGSGPERRCDLKRTLQPEQVIEPEGRRVAPGTVGRDAGCCSNSSTPDSINHSERGKEHGNVEHRSAARKSAGGTACEHYKCERGGADRRYRPAAGGSRERWARPERGDCIAGGLWTWAGSVLDRPEPSPLFAGDLSAGGQPE